MLSPGRLGTGRILGKPRVLGVLERLKEKQGGRGVLFDWYGREHRETDLTVWIKVSLSSTDMLELYRTLLEAGQ